MRNFLIICITISCISACGVKAPPLAPNRPVEIKKNVDCSVYDSECDAVSPDYIPQKKSAIKSK